MEQSATREREEFVEETGSEETADLSGGEYLAQDDREKAVGRNGVPHRPTPPSRQKQLRAVRQGERRPTAQDAG